MADLLLRLWVKLTTFFAAGEEGQDMVEYAIMAAVISIAGIAMLALINPYLKSLFQDVVNTFASSDTGS